MKFSYILPDPGSYSEFEDFIGDLACLKQAGYDAVELQIPDPALFDEDRVRRSLDDFGFNLCAFQTGTTYGTRGNNLSTANDAVRERTTQLLRSFVELAARWKSVIVFGSLQGRLSDEPDREAGSRRIRESIQQIGAHATQRGVTLAFEPVNHGEIGFHNTIAEVAALVRGVNQPGVRMMIDTFHMNIEEKEPAGPLDSIGDLLAHVHLSETNRAQLGAGHWPLRPFLGQLSKIHYQGFCSVGVYNSLRPRRDNVRSCMATIREALAKQK